LIFLQNAGGHINLLQGSAQIIFGIIAIISLRTKVHTTVLEEMQLLPLTVELPPNSLFMKQKNTRPYHLDLNSPRRGSDKKLKKQFKKIIQQEITYFFYFYFFLNFLFSNEAIKLN